MSRPLQKCYGRWMVDTKGGPMRGFEISVLREDFEHGRESYGWFDQNKRLISSSGGPCNDKVTSRVWKALIKVAEEECEKLNEEEGL